MNRHGIPITFSTVAAITPTQSAEHRSFTERHRRMGGESNDESNRFAILSFRSKDK
jgi:hypothetical protein